MLMLIQLVLAVLAHLLLVHVMARVIVHVMVQLALAVQHPLLVHVMAVLVDGLEQVQAAVLVQELRQRRHRCRPACLHQLGLHRKPRLDSEPCLLGLQARRGR